MKKLSLILSPVLLMLALAACNNECEQHVYDDCADTQCNECDHKRESSHTWVEANCTTAKTCSVCHATEGDARGHSYTNEIFDDYYHYIECTFCDNKDETTLEMHTFNKDYVCECGVELTAHKRVLLGGDAIVEFYNERDLIVKMVYYSKGEIYDFTNYYYNENNDLTKTEIYLPDETLVGYAICEYNQDNNLIKDSYYDDDGILEEYTILEYDQDNNLIKDSYYDGDKILTGYRVYEYDQDNNLIKDSYYESEGFLEEYTVYEYNEDSKVIEMSNYNYDGTLCYTIIYEYDANGLVIKDTQHYYDEYGILDCTDVCEYNEKGEYIKIESIYPDGYKIISDVDENGYIIKEKLIQDDGYEQVEEYVYDESGNIIKKKFIQNDGYGYVYEYVEEYVYDESGKNIKLTFEDIYGYKYVAEYMYDEHGDLIKSIRIYYDKDGNAIDVELTETEHNFSNDWNANVHGHYHTCQNEGCEEISEIIDHVNNNADNMCDECSYDFGYTYDADTNSYNVYSQNGLEKALLSGGNVVLNNDIVLTRYQSISYDTTLDLNGKSISISDDFFGGALLFVENCTLTINDSQGEGKIETNGDQIINVRDSGELIINGGKIYSAGYAIYSYGVVTINNVILSYFYIAGETDNLTITGGTFAKDPTEYLPEEYYAIYDDATQMWTVTKHDGIIDTFIELQAAIKVGGDITLAANIDMGSDSLIIEDGVSVNLNLSNYTLSSTNVLIYNYGTLTIEDGTFSNEVYFAIINNGNLTINGGTFNTFDYVSIHNYASLTINDGTFISNNSFVIDNLATLIINGGTFKAKGSTIYNRDSLTLKGGTIESEVSYAIFVNEGTLKLIGNNFTLKGNYDSPIYLATNDAYIDLSEYTGESFIIESAEDNMPLSNIILPEGWKLYDTNDNEITATKKWNNIVAKAEISQDNTDAS